MQAYVTRGTAYHVSAHCPLMLNGEALWDGDGEDYFHIMGSFRREVASPQYAAMCGKWPCLHCVPAEQRVFPPLYGQTFGHEPWFVCLPDFTKGYGCARCRVRVRVPNWSGDGWHHETHAVPWPCTSAVVLGLVPRGGA
jgi:hypothetical protein